MDPVCHTLVGLTLAESGLKHRAPAARALLMVGANLPDIDVAAYAWGSLEALTFRRGWTHGVPALMVLPPLLAAIWFGVLRTWARRRGREPVAFGRLALLAYLSVLTHPALDFLNTYGMRWLMPIVNRWFYGDTLFIVDPWVWLALAVGSVLASRGGSPRPAWTALSLVAGYIVVMGLGSAVARSSAARAATAAGMTPVRVLASPVPLVPWQRVMVVDDGARYHFGRHQWWGDPSFQFTGLSVERNDAGPLARAAAGTAEGRAFLSWARLPFFVIREHARGATVHIVDARYTVDPLAGFGAHTVEVTPGAPGSSP